MSGPRPTGPERTDWRARYEVEARQAAKALEGHSEAALLARIRGGHLDPYFAIWRAVARAGTVQRAAPVLWTFLSEHPGEAWMLHRYHCADALFRILGRADPASRDELRRRVQWDADGEEARQEALRTLRAVIEDRGGSFA